VIGRCDDGRVLNGNSMVFVKIKVKISLLQAMEAHRVARG
jgi:hypothetical protein